MKTKMALRNRPRRKTALNSYGIASEADKLCKEAAIPVSEEEFSSGDVAIYNDAKKKGIRLSKREKPPSRIYSDKIRREIYSSLARGNSYQETAGLLDLDTDAVGRYAEKHFPHLKDLDIYTENKVNILEGVQQAAMNSLLPKIPHATVKDLTNLIAIVQDKIQLLTGGPTQNIGMAIRVEDIAKRKEGIMRKLEASGCSPHEIDAKVRENAALPGKVEIEVAKTFEVGHKIKHRQEVLV